MQPFRFGVHAGRATSGRAWRDLAHRVEDLGYSSLLVPDHLDDQLGPLVAMTVAAEATNTLMVGSLVLANDFRHPAVLAKEAATLDLMSEGRFELGLGAGWMTSDYSQSGLALDPPKIRVDRLQEALEILTSYWANRRISIDGEHYQVDSLRCAPRRKDGRPRMAVGGGGRRVLELAAKYADIVSVVPSLHGGQIGAEMAADATPERFEERVGWVVSAAGAQAPDIEFQNWMLTVRIDDDAQNILEQIARFLGVPPSAVAESPLTAVGGVTQVVEQLLQQREALRFNYIVVPEASVEAFAPIVAKLAGT